MKVKDMHLYHGIALTQITEHSSFKALNKHNGHYLVNHDTRLIMESLKNLSFQSSALGVEASRRGREEIRY